MRSIETCGASEAATVFQVAPEMFAQLVEARFVQGLMAPNVPFMSAMPLQEPITSHRTRSALSRRLSNRQRRAVKQPACDLLDHDIGLLPLDGLSPDIPGPNPQHATKIL